LLGLSKVETSASEMDDMASIEAGTGALSIASTWSKADSEWDVIRDEDEDDL